MSNTTFSENQYLDNQSIISTGNDNINLHTGKLTMRFDIADMGSPVFPFTLALCYNKDSFTSTHCGLGWSLSAAQYIETFEENENEYVQAAYHDGAGQIHYFWRGENATDAGGLGMTFSTNPSGSGYSINDRSGSRMNFSTGGNLTAIRDANGNGVDLSYNENGLSAITSILANNLTNTSRRTITLNYENYKLISVTDPANRNVKFAYTKNLLKSITYPDSISVSFAYDSNDHITSVTDAHGVRTAYTYSNNKVTRVEKYPRESESYEQYTTFSYGNHSTTVKDRSGINRVYVFDESGRAITVYDETITIIENDNNQSPVLDIFNRSNILGFWDQDSAEHVVNRKLVNGTSIYRYSDKKCSFQTGTTCTDENFTSVLNGDFDDNVMDWDTGWDEFDRPLHQWVRVNDGDEYYFEQKVPASSVKLIAGDTLILSAWAKANNSRELIDDARFELRASAAYGCDSTVCANFAQSGPAACNICEDYTDGFSYENFAASFDPNITDWQYLAIPVTIDRTQPLNHIKITLDFSNNNGSVEFDNIRLVNAPAVSSVTEEKEPSYLDVPEDLRDENADNPPALAEYNITVFGKTQAIYSKITTHNGIYTTVTEKNSSYDVVRQTVTALDGNSFVSYFEYDDKHNLIRSQNYRGIMTEHSYNSVGMPTLTKTYYYAEMNPSTVVAPTKAFITETAYDSTGEFPISVTDERDENIKAQSEYDITKGLLTSETDPNGNRINYTYDANNDLVTKISMPIPGADSEYSVLYGYDKRRLTKITHNGFDYEFTYDAMGRAQTTKIAGVEFSTNSYTLTDATTVETTYATGEKMKIESDRHQKPIKRTYTDTEGITTVIATTEYDDLSRPTKNVDNVANKCYTYKYNSFGNVTEEKVNNAAFKEYEYDSHNRLTKTTFHNGTETQSYLPIYDKTADNKIYADNAVVGVTLDNVFTHKSEHDEYGRVTEKNLTPANAETPIISDEITYISSATRLTNMVSTVTQKLNGTTQGTFSYTYDNNGNITEIRKNNSLIAKYTYDEMNQLVREDNYLLNKTYIFTYDTSGNILSKKTYNTVLTATNGTPDSTINYTYASTGWKDQLVSYNGESIVYDVLGNPATYRGHNLTWGKLRQLNSFDSNTFTYNANGIRTSKNNITYTLDGTKILSETRPTGTIKYLYGVNGIIGFAYNGNTYYYEKNIQGDVTAIVDTTGAIKAKYVYDAWGNHTITLDTNGIGTLNPIRYRSYYFDTETGLYYLNSRYYDSVTCRFINADSIIDAGGILGYNMFAYCNNNPISFNDPNGTCIHKWFLFGTADCSQCYYTKLVEASQTIKYDVPLYRQGQLSLCWAFCQVMIEDYQNGEKSTSKLAKERAISIAKDYHKSDDKAKWNDGGWPLNRKEDPIEINNIYELYNLLIENNGPIYAHYSNDKGNSHLIVVTGVNLYKGEVYTNNPWGVRGTQSFESFSNGVAKRFWQGDLNMTFKYVYTTYYSTGD